MLQLITILDKYSLFDLNLPDCCSQFSSYFVDWWTRLLHLSVSEGLSSGGGRSGGMRTVFACIGTFSALQWVVDWSIFQFSVVENIPAVYFRWDPVHFSWVSQKFSLLCCTCGLVGLHWNTLKCIAVHRWVWVHFSEMHCYEWIALQCVLQCNCTGEELITGQTGNIRLGWRLLQPGPASALLFYYTRSCDRDIQDFILR